MNLSFGIFATRVKTKSTNRYIVKIIESELNIYTPLRYILFIIGWSIYMAANTRIIQKAEKRRHTYPFMFKGRSA